MDRKDLMRRLLPVLVGSGVMLLAWVMVQAWPSKPRPPAAVRTAVAAPAKAATIETAIAAVVDQANSLRDGLDATRTVLESTLQADLREATGVLLQAIRQEAALNRQLIGGSRAVPAATAEPAPTTPPPAAAPPPEPKPVLRPRKAKTRDVAALPAPPASAPPAAASDTTPAWSPRFPRPEARPDPDWRDAVHRR